MATSSTTMNWATTIRARAIQRRRSWPLTSPSVTIASTICFTSKSLRCATIAKTYRCALHFLRDDNPGHRDRKPPGAADGEGDAGEQRFPARLARAGLQG